MSRITDPFDRATAAVFADGAGAVVLERSRGQGRIGPVVLGSDGAGAGHIRAERSDGVIRMRGHETFREAVARLSLSTHQAVRHSRPRRSTYAHGAPSRDVHPPWVQGCRDICGDSAAIS